MTFDCGYEAGYTFKLLDILKENNVKAAFFITAHYLNTAPELVKRMIEEGHIVGNHTVNHKSMPDLADEKIKEEIELKDHADAVRILLEKLIDLQIISSLEVIFLFDIKKVDIDTVIIAIIKNILFKPQTTYYASQSRCIIRTRRQKRIFLLF